VTLNLRGQRSETDKVDNDPDMPDALEVAKALDEEFARTGRLKGPLHGIPFAIKDQLDTFDMRTTGCSAAAYANDRPPRDSEVVARLRKAGAVILAKSNMGEYASGDNSTFGGTSSNPYDTTRSAGRSSSGSGAAVAANLVMCAIAEETRPSLRNPASNNNIVGIAPTHSLVSRAGIIPASLIRDRPGPLCRTVRDAAIVLTVIAGYDPRDGATAASVGRMPDRPYESFADDANLNGIRIGVIRDFMKPFTKADEDSIRVASEAVADLAKAGATVIDPGPDGSLFTDAIADMLPDLDAPMLARHFKEFYSSGAPIIQRLAELAGDASRLPPEVNLRQVVEHVPPISGEGAYVLDRYLRERGDENIRSVQDLIDKSVFYEHSRTDGLTPAPRRRLEEFLTRTVRFTKKSDGTAVVRKTRIGSLDANAWQVQRIALQALVNKVMADHQLDALVYPTKTIPAPLHGSPVEPENIKVVNDTVSETIDGEIHERSVTRVIESRPPFAWRLSSNGGFPTVVMPAGFTREVYDRATVRGADGSKRAGELVGPKPIAMPVSIDIMGRLFSEPVLIRIAAAYERATRHRTAPKDFPALPETVPAR
jgi:Asp-tRNA(Asn)/Glu-tRNA(Gln) amidotransferase A subunit family amidase